MYEKWGKRIFDQIGSMILIIVLSPLLILIGLMIIIFLGSPVFFVHERPGKNEKIFKMYKFRTMQNIYDHDGHLKPDQERLTRFGRFLRKSSLDELPELFNILIGDMSFVGPRPLLIEYLPLYNAFQKKRHNVRPGLTGLAQINGRNAISWKEKFEYDIQYTQSISFWGDLMILFKTVIKVIKRSDTNAQNHVTVEAFKGNDDE